LRRIEMSVWPSVSVVVVVLVMSCGLYSGRGCGQESIRGASLNNDKH
jgi:hypothetical protein